MPILMRKPWVRPRVKEFDAMRQMLDQLSPANCFVPVSDILLAPPARAHGWHVIQSEDAERTVELLRRFGTDVLLNYLQHIMRMQMQYLGRSIAEPLENIWSDVAQWFGSSFRGRPAVLGAERLLWLPTQVRDELILREQSIEAQTV